MSSYGVEPGRSEIALYLSGEHPCSYLPGLRSRTLFVDPLARMDGARYQLLLEHGFRRSGSHIYRPECEGCRRCVPLRIPVAEFTPNRSQRRNASINGDLTLIEQPARFQWEHYGLYEAYLRRRHPGGGMSQDLSPESYHDFLIRPWGGETVLLELRLENRLAAVAVTDLLPQSLSAVYTFFDPDFSRRALGTCAVLSQITRARASRRDHLYLGYWIEECHKMSYKDQYRPLQAFLAGHWQGFGRREAVAWR